MTAKTTVTIAAVNASGGPDQFRTIDVRLVHGGAGGTVDGLAITDEFRVRLDDDGEGTIDLYPNSAITPAGTYYLFTAKGVTPAVVRAVTVPTSGPVDWTDDEIQVEDPSPPVIVPAPQSGDAFDVIHVDEEGLRYTLGQLPGLDELLGLGETSTTAYRGDHGKTAYDHSQATGNPHGTAAADITGLSAALAALAVQGAKADTAVQPQGLTDRKVPFHITFPGGTPASTYMVSNDATTWANTTLTDLVAAGRRVWVPIWIPVCPHASGWDRLSIYVGTAGTATWRVGLYDLRSDGFPKDPVLDAGAVNMAGATGERASTVAFNPTAASWYWGCFQVDAYTSNPAVVGGHVNSTSAAVPAGFPTQIFNQNRSYGGMTDYLGASGPLASVASVTWTRNPITGFSPLENFPRLWIKRS